MFRPEPQDGFDSFDREREDVSRDYQTGLPEDYNPDEQFDDEDMDFREDDGHYDDDPNPYEGTYAEDDVDYSPSDEGDLYGYGDDDISQGRWDE